MENHRVGVLGQRYGAGHGRPKKQSWLVA
jgi:hypothetical protein